MIGNRPSSLPIARFCAKAPALNVGAGRAAACSHVWHARSAGQDWQEAYARLTPEEQADIDSWKSPTDIVLENGVCLRYSEAQKETRVAIADEFGYLAYADPSDPHALTSGTCDFFWLVDRVLYVGDLKKSEYTEPDGPRSLQVKCYALALAVKHASDADGFVTGIFHAQEGTWEWGEYVALGSEQCSADWEAVRAAALHTDGDFSTGSHCRRCYARTRCPAYLMPPDQAEAGLVKYLSGELDAVVALEARLFLDRAEDLAKTLKDALKAHVKKHGGISDGQGKVWKPIMCAGKSGLDGKAIERDHPELVQRYYRRGAPYPQHRWVNEEK